MSLRLVRVTSRVRRCVSSSETFRLTVASGIPSLRDAPERLPASTAASNADMASSLSIYPSMVREDDSGFYGIVARDGRAYLHGLTSSVKGEALGNACIFQ